jgi:beta-lactam-binding protein with PASTA domain
MNRDRTADAPRVVRWKWSIATVSAPALIALLVGSLMGSSFAGAASKTTYKAIDTKAARVGATLYVKAPGGQDESATLVKVLYPAGDSTSRAEYGEKSRFIALLVRIANRSSKVLVIRSRSDTTLHDSTDKPYETLFASVKGCRAYPLVLKISPGSAVSGCYVFSIPSGVKANEFELYPEAGYWRIGSGHSRGSARNAIPVMVQVPNVLGLTVSSATQKLQGEGLMVGSTQPRTSTIRKGEIVSSNPPAGAQVGKNSPVNLVVSNGPSASTVTVPSIAGQQVTTATAALMSAGLTYEIKYVSSSQPSGTVLAENPSGGSSTESTTVVTLTVSSSQFSVTVPNVVGFLEPTAGSVITSMNLTIGTQTSICSQEFPGGQIIAQNPPSAAVVAPATPINLTISSGACS